MIDVDNLKKLTAEAIDAGKRAALEKEQKKQEREARKQKKEQRRAQNIINSIPRIAERAAKQGSSSIEVMEVCDKDFNESKYEVIARPTPARLKGAAKIVFEYCQQVNLNPKIENWDDGVGITGGYVICVYW